MEAMTATPIDAAPLEGTEHHPHARALLGAALAPGGTPSHAYLFHGPAGTGKRTAARAFAAELLARGAADPDSARGRARRGAHPDLTWVVPSGAHELRVADVKDQVVAAAAHTPFEADRRVFVIEEADAMGDHVGNRMLKTLEEPAWFVHLILLTDRPSEVMPTIASRCQAVRFDPLPAAEIATRLERDRGVDPDTARACARLAMGDGARAARLALGEGPALRDSAVRFARAATAGQMHERPWTELLEQAGRHGDGAVAELDAAHERERGLLDRREQRRANTEHAERSRRVHRRVRTETLDLGLALAALWYRDLACVALGAGDLACHCDREAELQADAAGRDPLRLRAAVDLVAETRLRLAVNVSEELACEALGYRLEAELALSTAAAA
jgi:DNA polymerase-3 subunit delta'